MTAATTLMPPECKTAEDEARWAEAFIAHIIDRCPRRQPTSADERRASLITRELYARMGLETRLHEFEFNDNLYANLVLHFGTAAVAAAFAPVAPLLASAVLSGVVGSYISESTRKAMVLRRLFAFRKSQNVLATLPSIGERRMRIVFVSHVDAAFTGLLFDTKFVKRFAPTPGPLYKGLRLATGTVASLGAVSLAMAATKGRTRKWLSRARLPLMIPSVLAAALNTELVSRNTIVPGAADNLSGVAGCLLLAARLADERPENVEFVFVSVGCEEASLGGSDALATAMKEEWSTDDTWVIGIDTICNGDWRWFREGEVFPVPASPVLERILTGLQSDPRFAELEPLEVPVGGTDAIPFALRGYNAVTIGCVDPTSGTPREYHQVSDNLANMDAPKIIGTLDLVQELVRRLCNEALSAG
jgi:hypothetical protein